MLSLEGAQAGLSWETILKRREGYRVLFCHFDPERIAKMTDSDLETVLKDARIIRNRGKVLSVRQNALSVLSIQNEHRSFSAYLWKFVGGAPKIHYFKKHEEVPAYSEVSEALAKDLKKRGMVFVGKTILYAFMQAVGMVHDHLIDCPCHVRNQGSSG